MFAVHKHIFVLWEKKNKKNVTQFIGAIRNVNSLTFNPQNSIQLYHGKK